ncbi:MAG: NADH-quinone oxidoreductase subunit NuoF [Clostridiales bacterium]|jgi:NADH:ubiquinone oxidoreductase subunit F (NADH-binding)/(2Fe-2S) ferredoxin/ferredoxin|nr:NADH-quinone oxidoreductase subunit NuoF [Clostridiales bacterium]
MRINTVEELDKLAKSLKEQKSAEIIIKTCAGTGCMSSDSAKILKNFEILLKHHGLDNKVSFQPTGCFGFCEQGPIVKVNDVFYVQVTPKDVNEIIQSHIIDGKPVERLLYRDKTTGEAVKSFDDIQFYKRQMRIALRNCGDINPESLEDYIARDGYKALAKSLAMSPQDVINEIKQSGLRGRGGAGFPTGVKWEIAANSAGKKKFVLCNADEGDPGAFMDRSILEGDPNSVIEAMAICAYSIGADEGVIYIRAEYPLAVHRLETAIKQATEAGLLGENIFGTNFSFKISLSLGAGAFVCGEETSLMNSVEGLRGEPRVKPPFPAENGLWQKPSNINNVETYANICPIILNGGAWFSKIGTEKSKGTKVFALAGKINNVGLVEVPMGTTLREVIFEIGEGIRNGKALKAVQTGGPSGGCIPAECLDMPIDYESLVSIGSMMGSGGMIVMDEDDCMVDVAKFYLDFTVDESCGKCTPCRIGNLRLKEILEKICAGNGEEKDLIKLKELGEIIKDTSLCGLGQTAPNPILSTMNYFMDEYEAHVKEKRCPAGKCKDLLQYKIDPTKCVGCTLCAKNCPTDAISGEVKVAHKIEQDKCIKCGTCIQKCRFEAISRG